MTTWTLINYFDVWGNEEDGWDVNNCCVEKDDIEMTDDCTLDDVISWLYWNEYVTEENPDLYEVEDLGDFLEIYEKVNMRPLYSLRRNVA